MFRENPVRGPAIRQDDYERKDPLLSAIAELRDQVDRLIDEQKAALGGLLGGLEEDAAVEPSAAAAAPAAAETAPKARRPSAATIFERLDEPSPTPPRPVATPAAEPPPASRSDDPRERLDALAKHLGRKLRQVQVAGPNGDPAPRSPE
jgi:hypothetical protein